MSEPYEKLCQKYQLTIGVNHLCKLIKNTMWKKYVIIKVILKQIINVTSFFRENVLFYQLHAPKISLSTSKGFLD